MLAIPGSEPSLAEATGRVPIIDPARVVLFGHGRAQATGWANLTTSSGSTWRVSRSKTLPPIPKRWRKPRLGCSRAARSAT